MKIENFEFNGSELPILTYPDPVLTAVAKPVTEFGAPLKALVQDMLFTMYHAPGIGLAAPQVGHSIRLFVIDVNYDKETIKNAEGKAVTRFVDTQPMVFVNPIITGTSGSTTYEEGCLSVPGVYEEVKRYQTVNVKYQDLDGNEHSLDADELLSICIQHENDHLDGIVFIERLSNLKKNFYKKKMIKEKVR